MKKRFVLMLVLVLGMSLFAGCGESETDNKKSSLDTDEIQEMGETADSIESEIAVITDVYTGEIIQVSYNTTFCEKQETGEYLLSVIVEDGEWFDIEFYSDYSADEYYQEQVVSFESMLKATEKETYINDGKTVYGFEFYENSSDEKYSQQLLFEVDGGLLIVHNSNLDITNAENAKVFAEKIFVSAQIPTAVDEGNDVGADTKENDKKTALTNEDKATVYKAEYEAIKDKIVKEEKDGSEASYYDENGNEIMYIYYNGENIENVFFYEYYAGGAKKSSRTYTFDENGEYDILDLEFHENGEKKTEIVYNDDGSKLVFSFDEEGKYVSGTEYDKNGNVIE